MPDRSRIVLVGYTLLDALVGFVALCMLVEMTSSVRIPLADYGAPIGMIAFFFLAPVVTITLWFVGRRHRAWTNRQRRFLLLSRLALFPAWVLSCLPIGLFVLILQPWPLTLMHGPDTEHAREAFERQLGRGLPASVSDLYYRADGGWGDAFHKLRFRCDDASFVDDLVRELELAPTDETGPFGTEGPSWWLPAPVPEGIQRFHRGGPPGSYWMLWFDAEEGLVFFEHWSA